VGVGVSHDVPMHQAKGKAVEAAERRAKQQRLLGGPGKRLGGAGNSTGRVGPVGQKKSPRELAAEVSYLFRVD
jgi:hypothetical protein